eukprot:738489-Prymnesium_polylepis.1
MKPKMSGQQSIKSSRAHSGWVASVVRVTWSIVRPGLKVNACICISHGAPTEYTNTYCGSRASAQNTHCCELSANCVESMSEQT